MTLTTLEICMIAIQLGLCMQLGTLCIQLSHLYSAPKLLEKTSFKLEPQYERSILVFSPGFFKDSGGGKGRHYGKEVGEMLRTTNLLLLI